ncbi:MAG: hypothetical protein RLZZ387_893 [Chloroflexota bacterium]|jgi:hypothetical protein
MAKVIGILPVRLKPDADPEAFERFTREVAYPASDRPDLRFSLLRGQRGPRAGRYVLMVEIADEATRDSYWPAFNQQSAAGHTLVDSWGEQWFSFVETDEDTTDYLVIGR